MKYVEKREDVTFVKYLAIWVLTELALFPTLTRLTRFKKIKQKGVIMQCRRNCFRQNCARSLPKLYAQEKQATKDKWVYLKFFFPAGNWTWFVTEGEAEGDDFVFFGFVVGDFDE